LDAVIIFIMICLLAALLYLIYKYVSYRKQIRKFTEILRRNTDSGELLTTDIFDKSITELAGALNRHTELRKQSAEEMRRYRKELTDTVSGISHDFRTPLTASLGYIQMLRRSGELSAGSSRYLDIIEEKNRYLKKLSDDLFELPSLERDNDEKVFENVDLSSLLAEKLFGLYKWVNECEIKTEFQIAEDVVINSDKHRIERIIANLLSNAEKYTLSALGVKLERNGDETVLSVWNDTEHPERTDIKRVFDMFYRSDRSRNGKGSGIGLYTSKLLCESIGAHISAAIENDVFKVVVIFK